MQVVLENILPSIVLSPNTFKVIRHQGISDLKKSLPNKLKNWKSPDTRFLILIDQDAADCKLRKAEFEKICLQHKKQEDFSVRIVCRELESWFLGDVDAILNSGLLGAKRLSEHRNKDICLNPDGVAKPSRRLHELMDGYQKVAGARAISPRMGLDRNTSRSFQVFIKKIEEFCAA